MLLKHIVLNLTHILHIALEIIVKSQKIGSAVASQNAFIWSTSLILTEDQIDVITNAHKLDSSKNKVPTSLERVHHPLSGYMSIICYHYDAGAIPPISKIFLCFCDHVSIIPNQLVSNTITILVSL